MGRANRGNHKGVAGSGERRPLDNHGWFDPGYDKAAAEGFSSEWKKLFGSLGQDRSKKSNQDSSIYRPPSAEEVKKQRLDEEEAREVLGRPGATEEERRDAYRTLGLLIFAPPTAEEIQNEKREIVRLEAILDDPATGAKEREQASGSIQNILGASSP